MPRPEHCLEIQAALAAGGDFAVIVEQAGLELDPGALTPFARWVPEFHAGGADTLFFIARAPAGDWQPHRSRANAQAPSGSARAKCSSASVREARS